MLCCFSSFNIMESMISGKYPSSYPWEGKKRNGHDLILLLDHITTNCFSDEYLTRISVGKEDIEFLRTDKHIHELVRLLSAFGQSARYYNPDVIKGQKYYDSPK